MNLDWGNLVSIAAAPFTGGASLAYLAANVASSAYANKQAKQQAEINRQFQAGMANTAHQREVEDLRAAGLNPILSATGGSGAHSPGGAMAPIQRVDNASAWAESREARRQNALLSTEKRVLEQQISTGKSAHALNDALTTKALAEAGKTKQDAAIDQLMYGSRASAAKSEAQVKAWEAQKAPVLLDKARQELRLQEGTYESEIKFAKTKEMVYDFLHWLRTYAGAGGSDIADTDLWRLFRSWVNRAEARPNPKHDPRRQPDLRPIERGKELYWENVAP